MAFSANIALLFLFTNEFGFWYLISSVIAFTGALFVSFLMQKYWTFRSSEHGAVVTEAWMTIILALINLILNTVLMYIFVELVHVYYLLAQVLAAGIIAIETYFVYKNIIFIDQTHTY